MIAKLTAETAGLCDPTSFRHGIRPPPLPQPETVVSQLVTILKGCPYLGSGGAGASANPEGGVLLLGSPRSGKTSSIIIPNVVSWPGPVLSASVRLDVLEATVV